MFNTARKKKKNKETASRDTVTRTRCPYAVFARRTQKKRKKFARRYNHPVGRVVDTRAIVVFEFWNYRPTPVRDALNNEQNVTLQNVYTLYCCNVVVVRFAVLWRAREAVEVSRFVVDDLGTKGYCFFIAARRAYFVRNVVFFSPLGRETRVFERNSAISAK